MLFDSGVAVGTALVKHPLIRAVAFTGSLRAGRALMDLAASRPDPIPCFTEMSSGNPVFILPGALRKGPAALAQSLFGSFTLGAGQFCTKPGVVFVSESAESSTFFDELKAFVEQAQPFTLLTEGIAREYDRATELPRRTDSRSAAEAHMLSECAKEARHSMRRPSFSPSASINSSSARPRRRNLRTRYASRELRFHAGLPAGRARALRPSHRYDLGDEDDLAANRELIHILEQKAGRAHLQRIPHRRRSQSRDGPRRPLSVDFRSRASLPSAASPSTASPAPSAFRTSRRPCCRPNSRTKTR